MSDQVLKSAGLHISWSAGSGLPGCAVKNVKPELNMQNLKPWLESLQHMCNMYMHDSGGLLNPRQVINQPGAF